MSSYLYVYSIILFFRKYMFKTDFIQFTVAQEKKIMFKTSRMITFCSW